MNRRSNRLNSAAAAGVCVALLLFAGARDLGASQVVRGHVPDLVTRYSLKPLRHYDATNRLRLAFSLPLRDKVDLTNLLNQIYDIKSPNYRHFVTAQQFAERFGPTPSDYDAVAKFAMSHNLVISGTHPNRALLDVEGSVADIEKAFNIHLQVYQHPTKARTFYAPDAEPSLDLSVPVLHIIGLDNAVLPFVNWKRLPKGRLPNGHKGAGAVPYNGSGPAGNYQGYDFRDAYVPGVTLTGVGQTVALFELDGYFASDVLAYEGQAGLPNVPLVNILLDGFPGTPQTFDGDSECTLDIDMAICMAPGVSSVNVYEGYVPEDVLNRIATDDIAKQISSSWGWEAFNPTSDQTYQQFAAQGQSYYNAAGDDGAQTEPQLVVPPSDDPYICSVGGTTLTTSGPLGSWVSEKVWSWFDIGEAAAGSGGTSFTYSIPTWQQGINMSQNGGSTSFRNYPDVALTADNIYIIADDGLGEPGTGGTSCAAPLWAGFTALVNQQAAANADPPLGFPCPTIYALAKSPNYDNLFHDITVGNDTNLVSPNLYFAYPGYDLCTGWGTPLGSNLINALAPLAQTPVLTVVTDTISGGNGNGVIDFDECNDLTIILTNTGPITATGIQATITSSTPGAIVAQGASFYPTLLPHNSAVNLSTFTISTEPTFVCGTPINLTMVVKCDQVTQTNYLTLPTGILSPPISYTNATALSIPDNTPVPVNSPIFITNLDSVGKITVSVYLSAVYDAGMSLSLVAPNGTNVLLSQFNGGLGSGFGTSCSQGFETIFDDAATTPITAGTAPFVGSFSPQQPLSTFHLFSGTNLNGIWNLQILDEFPGDTATLGCWSLNISPEVCTDGGGQCPGADLSLTMSAGPNPVYVNSNLTYSFVVSNAGPGPADNVVISQTLPPNDGFVQVTGYPATPSLSGSNLNLVLGSLPVYGSASLSVITIPTAAGLVTSTAVVGSQDSDPNPNNNAASASVQVLETNADIAVRMIATPSVVLQGGQLTYIITVTNNGPFSAQGVTLSNNLPTPVDATLVSATTTQGTITSDGTSALLGSIPVGTNVVVTIVVAPKLTGDIGASTEAFLTPPEVDQNTFNNSASASATVGPAADLAVSAVASPSPVIGGSNITYVVTLTNQGPSTATSLAFSQLVPAGCSFVSCSLPGSTFVSNAISASIASMVSGGSLLVTDVIRTPTLLAGVQSQAIVSTISVEGQPGDPNTNNNVVTVQTLAEPPEVIVVAAGATVISGSSNGTVGPTGRYTVQFSLQNAGTVSTTNLVATLENSNGITLATGPQDYGALAPGAAATGEQFSFTANSTNGGTITAILQLQDGTNVLTPVTNIFVMPVIASFWNTGFISIPTQTDIPEPDSGPANPYPSAIVVSNVTGDVGSVTVTVSNLFHTYPNDIGMLLVGPTGASCVLMSAAANHSTMTSAATVTFDQNAALVLPSSGPIVAGSYQPADYFSLEYTNVETFSNSPVPTAPYSTNLAVFGSVPANGTWRLYVEDESTGDSGAISNGWGLTITTITPINPVADLSASIVESTNLTILGNNVTYIWSVTNNGPSSADVFLTNLLSSGLAYVTNLLPNGVSVVQTGATNVFDLGTLASGAGLNITNIVMTLNSGLQTNAISVGSAVLDGNPGNNAASAVLSVSPPFADIVAEPILFSPSFPVLNSNVVYTLVVSNSGPSNAISVVGWFTNTAAMPVVSAVPSQGYCVTNATVLQCNLGTVPTGGTAVVTVTATASAVGVVTNYWAVTTTCTDTNLANNVSSAQVTVTLPRAIITNGPAVLLSQAGPPFNGAINSGQTNTVSFVLANIGSGPTTNLVATLQTNANLRPVTASNVYGAIPAGGSASNSFTFVGSGASGAAVAAALSLRDGTNALGTVNYNFMIPVVASYTNNGAIVIPDIGAATPYPAVIQVAGLTNGPSDLVVDQVTATFNGFAHTFPHDVEAVLVSPGGQEVVLMEHTGGPYSVSNLVFNFSDAAAHFLPTNTLSSGTFLSTEYSPFDVFPGLPAVPTNSTNLAYLNGMDANGIWGLYVYDDTAGNDGIIANGWVLGLTAISPVNSAARLEVSTIEFPNPGIVGDYMTYQVIVQNMGPGPASGVVLTDLMPSGSSLVPSSVALSQGTSSSSGGTLTCPLGTIAAGASATVTFNVLPQTAGTLVNTATATTISSDLYPPDATSVIKTPVSGIPPQINTAANLGNGTVQLTVGGIPGVQYAVQMSTNLVKWISISTNTVGTNGIFTFTNQATNAPARFYRAIQLPQ